MTLPASIAQHITFIERQLATELPLDFSVKFDVAALDTAEAVGGGEVFAVDREARTIRGLIVPFGKVGVKGGRRFLFAKGTVTWDKANVKRVKLYVQHDPTQAVGHAFELEETTEGIVGAFRVSRTPEGDRALQLADPDGDAVWDGFSIGPHEGAMFELRNDGIHHAVAYPLRETSLTPQPVFTDARATAVSMSLTNPSTTNLKGTTTMECTKCGAPVHAGACDPTTLATFEASNPPQLGNNPATPPAPTPAPGVDFSALTQTIADAVAAGFNNLANPQAPGGGREVVPAGAGGGATFSVREELPYRFDGGLGGEHSFTQDIKDGFAGTDAEARQRVEKFMDEAFAVTTTNVSALNPVQNRPELYVPNLTFNTPLYDMVAKGSIENQTAFTVPKFSAAAGLVGDHTQGTEPTPGSFSATNQTVTPAPMSGKIEVNREVWDQGGNPQSDGIIWGEMLNAWFEAREAKIAARLATTATAELNLAGVTDAALVDALVAYFAGLNFVRGGNRFTATAADSKLFLAAVGAKDSAGRKLLPVLSPTNAQGSTDAGFSTVQLGNQKIAASWALAQGANTRSYNFVPSSVWCWTSTPKRFTFEYQVKSVDMAIWGYCGTAILRDSDVKPIDYDTSDV